MALAVAEQDGDFAQEHWPLENGDRLDQPTFHSRYEAMPEQTRAELIEGVVYMASPVGQLHAAIHAEVIVWLGTFKAAVADVRLLDNPTIILGPESEPQPDAVLRLLPSHGGSSRDRGDYVEGAPELIVEIASSSVSYDLSQKRRDYERAGVAEYLVFVIRDRQVLWLAMEDGHYQPLAPGEDGILRSRIFPGLWLDPQALLAADTSHVQETVQQGLASTEHAAWIAARTAPYTDPAR